MEKINMEKISMVDMDWAKIEKYKGIDSKRINDRLKELYRYKIKVGSLVEIVSKSEFEEMCKNGDDYGSTSLPKDWMMSSGRKGRKGKDEKIERVKVEVVGNWSEMYLTGTFGEMLGEEKGREERKRYFVPKFTVFGDKDVDDGCGGKLGAFDIEVPVNRDKYLVRGIWKSEDDGEIVERLDWVDERWIVVGENGG